MDSQKYKVPDRWEDAAPLLLPKLRPRVWYTLLELRARAQGQDAVGIAHEPLGEHYAVELVCDFPQTCTSVPAATLAAWGKTFSEAMMTATRNLRGREARSVAEVRGKDGKGTLVIAMNGDTYDATRLLLADSVLETVGKRFDPVALPVHRDILLLADPSEPGSLELLAALGAREANMPYPIAAVPIRRSFGAWQPWLPPEGDPGRPALAALARDSITHDYTEQMEAIYAAHEREGVDIFVASRLGPTGPSDEMIATWTRGVHAWLPLADRVVLGGDGPDGEHVTDADVRWDALVAIAGHLMKPLDMWPPRWEVREYPDAATLAKLAAAAH